jgi:hypothetical protein
LSTSAAMTDVLLVALTLSLYVGAHWFARALDRM